MDFLTVLGAFGVFAMASTIGAVLWWVIGREKREVIRMWLDSNCEFSLTDALKD